MDAPTLETPSAAHPAVVLLPVAFLVHLAEEWFGGFLDWTPLALGYDVSAVRFVIINATAFVVFLIGAILAIRNPRMAWFSVSLASLLGLNGVLHTLATVGFGLYSPGVITGLLLYIPLSVIILRLSASRLSAGTFRGAVVLGVVLHGIVPILAFV
ncbi:MAG TPA: HXXEE domain-containing protein [Rhodothermia bacterium]|nr:HXXEE domain-containing protein [Rhodothermia bacterium]